MKKDLTELGNTQTDISELGNSQADLIFKFLKYKLKDLAYDIEVGNMSKTDAIDQLKSIFDLVNILQKRVIF
jgi:hypothetical protein